MNRKHMLKRLYALPLVVLAVLLAVFVWPEVGKTGGSMPPGSWSSGDRQTDGNRSSLGWKKLSNLLMVVPTPAKSWSPAVASTATATAVVWSSPQESQPIGSLWDRASGTWTYGTGFYPPPLPAKPVKSAPALIHREGDLLDLVVLGNDQYYHAFYTGGKWSGWEAIGVPVGTPGAPAITASKSGPMRLTVWVISKGTLWHQRWELATGWQGWKDAGHPAGVTLTAAPGAVVRSDNTLDIVVPAQNDGQLWHHFTSSAGVGSNWETIPGKTFTQPSLTSNAPGNLEVWVKGASDGIIYHEMWAGGQWQDFDTSINNVPFGSKVDFSSGPGVDIASGTITVSAISKNGEVLVRSWAKAFPSMESAKPTTIQIRRPGTSPGSFATESSAENTIAIAPNCNSVFLSLGNGGSLQQQSMDCVLKGTGEVSDGAYKKCTSSLTLLKNLGSTDNQVAVLKNGTVVLLRQGGGVNTETTRTLAGGNCRGIETISSASTCGGNWNGPVKLDPCDPKGPFDASFCNNGENTIPKGPPTNRCSNLGVNDRTGTDRPEMLASRFDGSVFMALGVAGAKGKYNLVLLRSDESNLASWKVMDTELQSGGASSLAESKSHLYLARCEYGSPANVGLYAYRKDKEFVAKNFVFLGNIAGASCSNGDVNISLMWHNAGFPVIRWVMPYLVAGQPFFKRGFSAVTPGGVATIATIDYQPTGTAKTSLPTLVARDFESRALVYWYELGTADNRWRIKASVSDGIGKWSPAFNLTDASWDAQSAPWTTVPSDYMKGYALKLDGKMKFLTQWIQPVGNKKQNEIFYGIVD